MIPLPSLSESLAPIAAALDAAQPEERINWMRGLGKRELRALYALAEGTVLPMTHFCDGPDPVRHHGQNSLPLFSSFEKRFVLQEGTLE